MGKLLIAIFIFLGLISNAQKEKLGISFGGKGFDELYDVDIDGEQNIILTGVFNNHLTFGKDTVLNNNGAFDIFILKLSPKGNFIWAKAIGQGGEDWGYNSVLDSNNNIYTCGHISQEGSPRPYVVKLGSDGNPNWSITANLKGEFLNISLLDNELILTGDFHSDSLICGLKYSLSGELIQKIRGPKKLKGYGVLNVDSNEIWIYGSTDKFNSYKPAFFIFDTTFTHQQTVYNSLNTSGVILSGIKIQEHVILSGQRNDQIFYDNSQKPFGLWNRTNFQSEKNGWAMTSCSTNSNNLIIGSTTSPATSVNSSVIGTSKGDLDILISRISKKKKLNKSILISGEKEEGLNKIVSHNGWLYLVGWHQGNLNFSKNIQLKDNGDGNAYLVRIKEKDLFKN